MSIYCRVKKYAWNKMTGVWVPFDDNIRQDYTIWYYEFGGPDNILDIPTLLPANYDDADSQMVLKYPEADWDTYPDQKLLEELRAIKKLLAEWSGWSTQKKIEKINWSGNIIPKSWYRELWTGKGNKERPYYEAIAILSEIVYWSRPNQAGKKKYAKDLLQLSYNQIANRFCMAKSAAKAACDYLEEFGIIHRVFRHINPMGQHHSNVMYIELNLDELRIITYPVDS